MNFPKPLLLGHRGARRYAPENTIAALDLALEHGCDGFEFDVRLSADQQCVICHDAEYGGLAIAGCSFNKLTERLASLTSLEAVITRYAATAFLDIELKVAGAEMTVARLIAENPPARGYAVSSFFPKILTSLHAAAPQLMTGLIAAAKFARQVTLVDIAARSVHFAAFNVALNGLTNVRVLQGDTYEPLGDQQFDVIVAHPPYVPSLETEFVFRDAGEDGEDVTRRMLAGLAAHLRPGGQFFCECMLTERRGAVLEKRVRDMLGSTEEEFDLVLVQGRALDPLHFFADQAQAGYASFERLPRWSDILERLQIQQLVFTSLLAQRRATPRPVITTRRALSPLTSAADLQWVLRWMVGTGDWDVADSRRLLASRPRTLPRTELRSRSTLQDGQWSVEECQLVTLAPFAVEAACPNWYATLLQFCDGRMTAREHLQYLRDTHAVPDTAAEDMFAMMIRQLVDAGLVEIDEFRLPDATAMRESVVARERATGTLPIERAD